MSKQKKAQGIVRCEVCGNDRNQCFEVWLGSERHIFDSFECAMHALSPKCAYCNCQLSGQGLQVGNVLYCSSWCANAALVRDYESRIILNEQVDF